MGLGFGAGRAWEEADGMCYSEANVRVLCGLFWYSCVQERRASDREGRASAGSDVKGYPQEKSTSDSLYLVSIDHCTQKHVKAHDDVYFSPLGKRYRVQQVD